MIMASGLHMAMEIWVNIGSSNGFLPDNIMSLSAQMLNL